jgi:hypothetical protein
VRVHGLCKMGAGGDISSEGPSSGCEGIYCISWLFVLLLLFSLVFRLNPWIRLQQGCVTLHTERVIWQDAAFRRGLG